MDKYCRGWCQATEGILVIMATFPHMVEKVTSSASAVSYYSLQQGRASQYWLIRPCKPSGRHAMGGPCGLVVDLLTLKGLPPTLLDYAASKPLVVLANKQDLLPKQTSAGEIAVWAARRLEVGSGGWSR